jgi:predicted phosphodiesterase
MQVQDIVDTSTETPLRIQLISDTHFEFHKDGGVAFIDSLDATDVDVLVVAGDMATEGTLFNALVMLCDKYPDVVYVEGNHEFYSSDRGRIVNKLEKASRRLSNLHWLQETAVTIKGQRFLGSTMWFRDVPEAHRREHMLADFRYIRGFKNWVYKVNRRALDFFEEEMTSNDIVVTHHLPCLEASHVRWHSSPIQCYFVCDMGDLIDRAQPKLWLYGHTHDAMDAMRGGTRLVANPFGYRRHAENPGFDWKKVIEVYP